MNVQMVELTDLAAGALVAIADVDAVGAENLICAARSLPRPHHVGADQRDDIEQVCARRFASTRVWAGGGAPGMMSRKESAFSSSSPCERQSPRRFEKICDWSLTAYGLPLIGANSRVLAERNHAGTVQRPLAAT